MKIEETPVKPPKPEESRYNTNKSSLQKMSKLDLDKIVIITQSPPEKPLHIEDDFISVPFSVIKLAMSEHLRDSIR